MQMDILNDALEKIKSYENRGKKEIILKPISNLIFDVLSTLQKAQYIGEVERIEDGRGGVFKVQLLGRINKCQVIKPRFSIKVSDMIQAEKQYLPAVGFGILVLSTPLGVMDQHEATEKHTGGRLLAFAY